MDIIAIVLGLATFVEVSKQHAHRARCVRRSERLRELA
jgi:hypothetical protein